MEAIFHLLIIELSWMYFCVFICLKDSLKALFMRCMTFWTLRRMGILFIYFTPAPVERTFSFTLNSTVPWYAMWLFLENIWRAKVTRWVYELYINNLKQFIFEGMTYGALTYCSVWSLNERIVDMCPLNLKMSTGVFSSTLVYSYDGMKMVNIFIYEWLA